MLENPLMKQIKAARTGMFLNYGLSWVFIMGGLIMPIFFQSMYSIYLGICYVVFGVGLKITAFVQNNTLILLENRLRGEKNV